MRLNNYICEVEDKDASAMLYEDFQIDDNKIHVFSYLMEMNVVKHDSTIKKVSPYEYMFEVNDVSYTFTVQGIEYEPDQFIYSVQFGTNNGLSFDRINKHNVGQTREVFQKVITCLVYFIKDVKPEEFTFTGHDKQLYKLYKMIAPAVQKKQPFINYTWKDSGRGLTFTLRK